MRVAERTDGDLLTHPIIRPPRRRRDEWILVDERVPAADFGGLNDARVRQWSSTKTSRLVARQYGARGGALIVSTVVDFSGKRMPS